MKKTPLTLLCASLALAFTHPAFATTDGFNSSITLCMIARCISNP